MRRWLFAIGAATVVVASPAFADSTKDRLARAEAAIAELEAAQPAAADSAAKINRLQEEVQALTGQVEQLTHRLDQANARLDAISAALATDPNAAAALAAQSQPPQGQSSLGQQQGGTPGPQPLVPAGGATTDPIGARIAQSTAPDQSASPAPLITLPADSEAAFQFASDLARKGDYAGAQKAFQLYLKTFPRSPRAADAQFRLGEIYLATGANAEAADAFLAHIKTYPNDPHAAEAYLKLGSAFARLGRNTEACKVFAAAKAKFANAAPAVRQRIDLEAQRAVCK